MFGWRKTKAKNDVAVQPAPERSAHGQRDAAPLTAATRRQMASRAPSFTELLPWRDYEPSSQVFILNDGVSVGALFEVTPIPTEAQSESILEQYCRKVQAALQTLPESGSPDWIVQFFVNDDRNIEHLVGELEAYIDAVHAANPARAEEIKQSRLTRAVVHEYALHVANVSRDGGLFDDTQVSGHTWRGQIRRVRCCIYRQYPPGYAATPDAESPSDLLNRAADTLVANLEEAGARMRRCGGADLYQWLLPFFNRGNRYGTTAELLRTFPYPGDTAPQEDGQAPIVGRDIATFLNLSLPQSDPGRGGFTFDGVLMKALTLQQITANPEVGHLTAERKHAKHLFARFDRMPENAMLSMTIIVTPQDVVRDQVERIRDRSKAKSPDAEKTSEECRQILRHMHTGDRLMPTFTVLYLAGADERALRKDIATVNARLGTSGLRFIEPAHDLTALDAFIRALPMCFDPQFDARNMKRTRYLFASQIAAMLPVYGRQRGTGHPGFPFWNRGGEPLWIDPLNPQDRKKNAHLLTLGPTGAGKSATLNFLALFQMAIHRPRLTIADAGKSFQLLKDYFASMGLSTHYVELTPHNDVSLPPFAMGARLARDPDIIGAYTAARSAAAIDQQLEKKIERSLADDLIDNDHGAVGADAADPDDEKRDEEKRDYLGEMTIAAIMMITGGEQKEIERLTRADRYVVGRAIITASMNAHLIGRPHPLTQDVAQALMDMNQDDKLPPERRQRAYQMGESMMVYTMDLKGKLFNRYGQQWPDADVTLVELGTLVQDGYEDALAVAYTGLLDHVHASGEAHQHEGRPHIFLTDEGHVITTNALLGPKIVKATKMWRKLGIWFWLATQDMKDFPESMSRVLNMCEFWLLLTMEAEEVKQVARFKALTDEERLLMLSTRKEPPKYTEGVLLSSAHKALFRNVPPPLAIALAMTEGHEKARRKRIMEQHGVTEMDAAIRIARELAARSQ
jgi:conjugative transfer ATPase